MEENLLSYLGRKFPDSSKATLRKMINEGRILVRGLVAKSGLVKATEGQVKILSKRQFLGADVKLLYSDNDIAVVDKPYGLLSVSTNFETKNTMHSILKQHFPKVSVYPVHRLDQDTSGLLVFALSTKARDVLKKEFEERRPKRRYFAVVEGQVDPPSGVWRSYLKEGGNYTVREADSEDDGKLAVTHYKTVKKGPLYTLLELRLETGRKNQIRVHCQAAGIPVAGDKKYGAKTNPCKRLMLHAFELSIVHPVTNKKIRFESIVPEEFLKLPLKKVSKILQAND